MTPRGLALIEAKVAAWNAAVAGAADDETRKKAKRDLAYWNTRLSTARVAGPTRPWRCRHRLARDVPAEGCRADDRDRRPRRGEPAAGRLAFSAPLAKAMIGAGAEDAVDFGSEMDVIEVLAVERSAGCYTDR